MSEERITKLDNTTTLDVHPSKIVAVQCCMLCENSKELPNGMRYSYYPWVCDECKEAISFLKFLKSYDTKLVDAIMKSE